MMEGGGGYLPYEWRDDARMRVLMGSMPPINDTVATMARLTFWGACIHNWCRATMRPTFTAQECEAAFRRGTQTPRCLPEVLHHMYRQGELLPLSDVMRLCERPVRESWGAWGTRVFVKSPALVAWSLVRQAVGWGGINEGIVVDTVVLKEMSDRLLNTIHQYHHQVPNPTSPSPTQLFTLPQLYSLLGVAVAGGSADTLRLLVDALVCQGSATVAEHRGTTFVKFIMPGDLSKPEITEMELAENELTRAQNEVQGAVRRMTEEAGQLRQQAKGALQAGSRIEALSLLRRKKHLEKSLQTQLGALENISSCLQQLQHSRLNKQVLGAFRVGLEALRVAVGGEASPEGAANTLDELQQVLEECDDVTSLVSGGVMGQGESEDADLEAELDSLLGLDQRQPAVQDTRLPDVPKSNPLSSPHLAKLPDVPNTKPLSSVTPKHHSPPVRYGLPHPDLTPEEM